MTTIYSVFGPDGSFLLAAPGSTLVRLFGLHRDAMGRIAHETQGGGSCDLHLRGQPWPVVTVQERQTPL